MKKVKVGLQGNPYDVIIENGLISNLKKEIIKRNLPESFYTIIDRNVKHKYPNLLKQLNINPSNSYTLTASEKKKNYETLIDIHKKMIHAELNRDSVILSIGGGITGDVGGFAASTFMRGIKYIQIPTTLLAAIDSSVGGKTGINFKETKNVIGSFYQPHLVLIDPDFFKTLPKDEILCGVGELLKYAFITSPRFYKYIIKNLDKIMSLDRIAIQKVITESVQYKSDVVIADEKESNLRKVLNFGHTFAHAIEVEQNHKLKHGQAVIVGISCALQLSNKAGLLNSNQLEKFLALLNPFYAKIKINNYKKHELYKIMKRDKKNVSDKIKFVLIKDIGELIIDFETDKKDVLEAIDNGILPFAQ